MKLSRFQFRIRSLMILVLLSAFVLLVEAERRFVARWQKSARLVEPVVVGVDGGRRP